MMYALIELGVFIVIAAIAFSVICLTKKDNDWGDKDDPEC